MVVNNVNQDYLPIWLSFSNFYNRLRWLLGGFLVILILWFALFILLYDPTSW